MFAGYISGSFTVPSGVAASVTTNSGGPTSVTAPAGTYSTIADFLGDFVGSLTTTRPVTGGAWSASLGSNGDPRITIAVSTGTFSISWTSTALRDLLGYTGNISSVASSTATTAARGVWMPDCPAVLEQRHRSAPRQTDMRQTRSPSGAVISNIGNFRYRHSNLMYSAVPVNKVWRIDETYTNESLEQWLDDTQLGQGHNWFSVGAKCRIVAHDGNDVGGTVNNWWLTGFRGIGEIAKRREDWDGLWSVAFPDLTSDGLAADGT